MKPAERLDLAKRRGIGDLFGDALGIYARNFATVFAIGLAIVVPVQLIVSGIGLEELTSGYGENDSDAGLLVPVVSYLVVAPLIAAAAIHLLQRLANGERPHAGRSIQAGLDFFAPVFLAVLLAGLGTVLGLILLIVPGIYVAVRWYFVPQAVVIDSARSSEALRASWRLTKGFWLRTFATVLLANLAVALPAVVLVLPFEALAESADRQAIALAGMILTEALTAPFIALVSTLLFFDIRARRTASDENQTALPI
ncbi:MAG TPA: YciC family protein [Thermoleophilaceae bacterium]|nr:YciC family protein [Thermoleophilaceae bacterium]